MAKRRKLEAPSADDLSRIEEEFRRETSPAGPGIAPIAQVAAESAMNMEVVNPEMRAKLAELEKFKAAERDGLITRNIPLHEIVPDVLTRDRVALDPDEFRELKASIVLNGLRMPIEVYEMEPEEGRPRYGLVSGYRRFKAVSELRGQPGQEPGVIQAIVRKPKSSAASMEAMVEENEVRSSLTHFERGRISVLAAQNGIYGSAEEAVERLFPFASKAKRSKIRSFASVFEGLGDVLTFPQALTEKQGLSLAAALRDGAGEALRQAVAAAPVETAEAEWEVLEQALGGFAAKPLADPARGGRPKQEPEVVEGLKGTKISWKPKGKGYVLTLDGDLSEADIAAVVSLVRVQV